MEINRLKNVKLLAFSGNAGTGKDFICLNLFSKMLTDGNNFLILSFADQFKVELISKEGLDREKVYGQKDKQTRLALQKKGSEEGRALFGDDIWIKILYEKIIQYSKRGIEYFFITDCRFPNEQKFIKTIGGYIIKIVAEDRHNKAMIGEENKDDISVHNSEQFIKQIEYDYIIDNSFENCNNVASEARNICLVLREKWKYPQTIFCDLDDTLLACNSIYIEAKDKIRSLVKDFIPPSEFDSIFRIENAIIREKVFSRYNYKNVFSKILLERKIPEHIIQESEKIAMDVHEHKYKLFSQSTLDQINKFNENYNLVIVTLGDAVDQIRKLYMCGLSHIKIECVNQKVPSTYAQLMQKYRSEKYVMIGDSLEFDIIPARKAGIERTILIDGETKFTDIHF